MRKLGCILQHPDGGRIEKVVFNFLSSAQRNSMATCNGALRIIFGYDDERQRSEETARDYNPQSSMRFLLNA
jgi:hypothetical protein